MYIVLLRNTFSMILPHGGAKKCDTAVNLRLPVATLLFYT